MAKTVTDRPRGIEHIGITVPDMAAALRFLEQGLGAEVLYAMTTADQDPISGEEMGGLNGMPTDVDMREVRMVRLGNGPNLELFEMTRVGRDEAAGLIDVGIHHMCVYCDDLDAVAARAEAAGGTLLEGPVDMSRAEAGTGNRNRYVRAPWGTLVELAEMPSLGREALGRWLPASQVA